MNHPEVGAGIWAFQQLDRYATDGSGPAVSTLKAIDLAAGTGDIAYLDINYPFAGNEISVTQVRAALKRTGIRAEAITPRLHRRAFRLGSFTNPDAATRRRAVDLCTRAVEVVQERQDALAAQRLVMDMLLGTAVGKGV